MRDRKWLEGEIEKKLQNVLFGGDKVDKSTSIDASDIYISEVVVEVENYNHTNQ